MDPKLTDPRLALHATSALPAWLWSIDGTRVLWANPVGAIVFGATNGARLAGKTFGPADPHRRQIAQLANRLSPDGAVRLERMRGFGATLGSLVTCACMRLEFADGSDGILVATADPVGRTLSLAERLKRLVDDADGPMASFERDGTLVTTSSDVAVSTLRHLSDAALEPARQLALKEGRAEASFAEGHVTLLRVGSRADTGLLALIMPRKVEPAAIVPDKIEPAAIEPDTTTADTSTIDPATADAIIPVAPPTAPTAYDKLAAALTAAFTPKPEPPHPAKTTEAAAQAAADANGGAEVASPSHATPCTPQPRRHPLRFMWQMDADGRFSLGSDAFTRLIGTRTAAGFGRPWQEIADVFGLDPDSLVAKATATRQSWNGITLNWPVDDGRRLPVELSGLPIHDAARNFIGYRGFGLCRDLDALTQLEALRSQDFFNAPPSVDTMLPESGPVSAGTWPPPEPPVQLPDPSAPDPSASDSSVDLSAAGPTPSISAQPKQSTETQPTETQATDLETPVETPQEADKDIAQEAAETAAANVVLFRAPGDLRTPVLTPVENSAFNELARQLSARLEGEATAPDAGEPPQPVAASPAVPEAQAAETRASNATWLVEPQPPARADSRRDKMLLDLLPTGILVYRLDRLLYANHAFLERMGYSSVHALEQAGGVDALYVEQGVSNASSTSDTGTPVKISSPEATSSGACDARLHTIDWDNESALALIFTGGCLETAVPATAPALSASVIAPEPAATIEPAPQPEPVIVPEPEVAEPSPVGHANAEELAAILDTTADGILMFDAQGNISSCNRSAEALFGYDGEDLTQRNLMMLFAPESESIVRNYLDGLNGNSVASLLEHGREVLGRVRGGGLIPLSMTMGRTQAAGPNFFAVFSDLSQIKKSENELRDATRLADRSANAKAGLLARISHEIRTPLNAIIGFAEVMIGERFGALGNERYTEYMKDVRSAGQRVITVIDDLTNLSRIETGNLDLAFANQNLNDLVESCVAVMQPQANRERIIIRTSLAQTLPPVVADGPTLRQITMNLIGNSIHLAKAGGQVIVSTAMTDFGEVALRIRDTGHGLNDNEVAAALEPFRAHGPTDQSPEGAVSLSLTKALVEANRAQFNIKTGARSGTLVEVVFSKAMAKA